MSTWLSSSSVVLTAAENDVAATLNDWTGIPVAKMLEPSQLWVRVYVPEPQLGRVRVGQGAALTVDTYPKREFPGKVVEIRTQSEYTPRNVQTLDQRMDQVFGVKVEIAPAPELKPGMAANVRLLD